MTNLYEILGVDDSYTSKQIKAAYFDKAKKAHPDVGGDPEEFKKLTAAYAVLGNPDKRAEYDLTGNASDHADNERALAIGLIQGTLQDIFSTVGDGPIYEDMVFTICSKIKHGIGQIDRDIATMDTDIGRLTRFADRFNRKGDGDNLLKPMIEARIRGVGETKKQAVVMKTRYEAAIGLLDGHTFDADQFHSAPGFFRI